MDVIKRLGIVVELQNGQLVAKGLKDVGAAGENVQKTFAGAEKSFKSAGSSLGPLRAGLVLLTRNALDLNPAIAQTASVLGSFALGAGPMVAIIAGVGALALAYEKLTASARKAREEHEQLIKVIEDLAKKSAQGPAGAPGQALKELLVDYDVLLEKIKAVEAEKAKTRVGGVIAGGGGYDKELASLELKAASTFQLIQVARAEVDRLLKEAADKRKADLERQAEEERKLLLDPFIALTNQLNDVEWQLAAAARAVDPLIAAFAKLHFQFIKNPTANFIQTIKDQLNAVKENGLIRAADLPKGKDLLEEARKVTDELRQQAEQLDRAVGLATQLASVFGRTGQAIGSMVQNIVSLYSATKQLSLAQSQAATGTGASGAVGTAALGVAAGGVGLVVGFASAIKASADAAEAARIRFVQMNEALDATAQSLADQVNSPDSITQALRQFAAARAEVEKLYPEAAIKKAGYLGAGYEAERNRRLAELNDLEAKRIEQLQEEAAAVSRATAGGLGVRNLRAAGQGDAADALAQSLADQAERLEWIKKYGKDSAEVLSLIATQNAEAAARQQAAESAKAIQQLVDQSAVDAKSRMDQANAANTILQQQVKLMQDAKDKADEQLKVVQEQLRTQQQTVDGLRRTYEAIRGYSDSLKLSNLTPLSAQQQYLEAKRQYDTIAVAAAGGDQAAAQRLPEFANAFLEQSRFMFSSTSRYIADYQQVQTFLGALQDQYGTQLSTQEQILAVLQDSNDKLSTQIGILAAQLEAATRTYVYGTPGSPGFFANGQYYFQNDPQSPYYQNPNPYGGQSGGGYGPAGTLMPQPNGTIVTANGAVVASDEQLLELRGLRVDFAALIAAVNRGNDLQSDRFS